MNLWSTALISTKFDYDGLAPSKIEERNMKIAVGALAALLVFSESAQAADCKGWASEEYWVTATVANATACLDAGADLNKRGQYRITPMHWAVAFSPNPEVIKALLAGGADSSIAGKCLGNTKSMVE